MVFDGVMTALTDVDRDGSGEREIDGDDDIDIDVDVVTVVVREISELRDLPEVNEGRGDFDGLRDARAVADTFVERELRVLFDGAIDTVTIVEKVLIVVAERESNALFDKLDWTVSDGVYEVSAEAVREDKPELFVGPSETDDETVNVSITEEVKNDDAVLVADNVADGQEDVDGIGLFDSCALSVAEKRDVIEDKPFVGVTLLLDVTANTL